MTYFRAVPISPPAHSAPLATAVEQFSKSSSDKLVYWLQLFLPFAFALRIAYASEIVLATEKLQQEPHCPWSTGGTKQPLYSCLKS